jgi:hypothetical protein
MDTLGDGAGLGSVGATRGGGTGRNCKGRVGETCGEAGEAVGESTLGVGTGEGRSGGVGRGEKPGGGARGIGGGMARRRMEATSA